VANAVLDGVDGILQAPSSHPHHQPHTTYPPCPAEATDVANAVLDGVDGILLGAETLRGEHPVLTVQTVLKLCYAAERHFDNR